MKIISYILHPVLVPTYGACMLAFCDPLISQYMPLNIKLFIVTLILLFTAIIPTISTLLMLWYGKLSNTEVSIKEERYRPYIITIFGYMCAIYSFWQLSMPIYWIAATIGACTSIIILFLINFKWKISAHAAAIGGILGATIAFGYIFHIKNIEAICLLVLISGCLCSIRIHLKEHSLYQTLAGWVVGLISTASAILFIY